MTRRELLAALVLLACGPVRAQNATVAPTRLLVPAYFYPAGAGLAEWKRLIASASTSTAPVVAIVNPASGPGERADDNYRTVFRLAKGSRLTTIGYVTLGYGKRSASSVKAEVDRWLALYPGVQGIFFDEQPSGPELAPFARECFAHARAKFPSGTLVSNPGVSCAPEYLAGPEGVTVCLFEHHEGFDAWQPPAWAARFGPERFAILLYGVPASDLRRRFDEATRKRAGVVYVTDAPGPMPWGRLPSYWAAELDAAARGGR
jgi:hypothetical protein